MLIRGMRHVLIAGDAGRHFDRDQVFLKILRVRDDLPVLVEDAAIPIEDQLIIAANLVDVNERAREAACLRSKQLQPKRVLSNNKWRSTGIDHQLRAGTA